MFHQDLSEVVADLVQLGFKQIADNYVRDGLILCVEPGWLTFRADTGPGRNSAGSNPPSPGLWKTIRRLDHRKERVCDVPLEILPEPGLLTDEAADLASPLGQIVDWVNATRMDQLPAGWRSPLRDEVEASVPDLALTLEVGPFARQGTLVCDNNRLSVSFPVTQSVPNTLSPPRLAGLGQLLEDLQMRFRMVRLVESRASADGQDITAQIDLSGVPRFALQRLLRISIDALRHVLSKHLATVDLFANPAVTSTVWEIPSVQE